MTKVPSPAMLAMLEAWQQAAGQAKNYRELEQLIDEQRQAFARLQFAEQAAALEARLQQREKKAVRTAKAR